MVGDSGIATSAPATLISAGLVPALTVATLPTKPPAHGAMMTHETRAVAWLHGASAEPRSSGDASVFAGLSAMFMPGMPSTAAAMPDPCPAPPGKMHVVPAPVSTSCSANENDSSRATSGERLIP